MKLNKNLILKTSFVILIIASVIALFVNKGLYYFEFNTSVEVQMSGSQTDVTNFIQSLSDPNLIRIDKINDQLYFENEQPASIQTNLTNLNKDNKVLLSISENFYDRNQVIVNDVFLSVVLILTSIGIYVYVLLKNKKILSLTQDIYIILSYFELTFFSNLLLAGLISLLSRYYQVRGVDLIAFVFMNVWLSLIFFTAVWRLEEDRFENISSLYASEDFYHKNYLIILAIILITLTFGLGVNFVVIGGLILIGILFVTLTYYNLGNLINFEFKVKKPNLSLKLLNLRKNSSTLSPNNQNKPSHKVRNKNKKNRS